MERDISMQDRVSGDDDTALEWFGLINYGSAKKEQDDKARTLQSLLSTKLSCS